MRPFSIAAAIVLLALRFAFQNPQDTLLSVYFSEYLWEGRISMTLLIILTLIVGIAVGMLILMKRIMNDKQIISELKKKIVFLDSSKTKQTTDTSSKQV